MHSQGIAHGDFHAENVMLGQHGVKIIDILYHNSLADLTTIKREEKLARDISGLKYLLSTIVVHSDIDPGRVAEFGRRVYQTGDASVMGELVIEVSAQTESPADSTPALPSIRDLALATSVFEPKTLSKYTEVLEIGVTAEELAPQIPLVIDLAERARSLRIPTRELLSLIVGRLKRRNRPNGGWDYENSVLHPEVVGASGLPSRQVIEHVSIMIRHGIASVEADDNRVDKIIFLERDW